MNFSQPGPSIRPLKWFSNGRMVSKVIIPNSFPQFTLKCTKLFWVSHQRRSTCNFLPKYSASFVSLTERFCRILSSQGLVFSNCPRVPTFGQMVKKCDAKSRKYIGMVFIMESYSFDLFLLCISRHGCTLLIFYHKWYFFACILISQCLTGSAIVLYL